MPQAAMIFGDSVEPDQMYHLPYVTHDQFNSETYIDIILSIIIIYNIAKAKETQTGNIMLQYIAI